MIMIKDLQTRLRDLGFDPGPIDGAIGPRTAAALTAFFAGVKLPLAAVAAKGVLSVGLAPMRGAEAPPPQPEALPWMRIARQHLGLSEVADNAALRAFLRSDGATLGDPAKLPWCGDFVQTCIKLGLPGEPFTGAVKENPYWARNWLSFGDECTPSYGAVGVAARDGGGHVFFAVGQDASTFFALGGNQGDAVSIVPIAKTRVLGFRWPKTTGEVPLPLPRMALAGARLSTNEA